MDNVFQKARDKRIRQATANAEKGMTEQQVTQSHILLATLEEAVNHFVANSGADLKLNQDKIREMHQQHHLCLEGQRLGAPHESQ